MKGFIQFSDSSVLYSYTLIYNILVIINSNKKYF